MKVPEPRKLPSGTWFIQLRLGGKSISVTGETASACKRSATLIKAEHQAEVRQKRSETPRDTLGAVVDKYIASRKDAISPATLQGYSVIRKNRFKSYMDKPAAKIDFQEMCNEEASRVSAKTLHNSWLLVVSALNYAGIKPPRVTLPAIPVRTRPWLTPEEVKTFIAAIAGSEIEIPALLGLSSLRRSEILALTWDQVDLKNKSLRVSGAIVSGVGNKLVRKETNKNDSSTRSVPIIFDELEAALRRAMPETRVGVPVVTVNGNVLYKRVNAICKKNGLPEIGVHGLRHSFASLCQSKRIPEDVAMKIGGWSDYHTMKKIYTHISDADMSKYADELRSLFA